VNRELPYKRASQLIGKAVYDASASLIGTVADIELNSDKTFSLILSTQGSNPAKTSRQLTIEANEIAIARDAILLKTTREGQQKRCPECGNANPIVARYCRECGTELSRTDYELIRGPLGTSLKSSTGEDLAASP
jgi:sporulation protein YlmC with PRC-barrel domain